ncbi:MAG: hypothetical protein HGA75_04920 [Thiobacillus sp.]|nr:hypothetical protein [Thiobacillus sp.]
MDFKHLDIPPDLAARIDRQPYPRESNPLGKILIGAVTIAIGVYLGFLAYTKYMVYEATQALQQFNAQLQQQADQARQLQLALAQERTRQMQLEVAFRQRQIERQLAEQEAARRKEAAWNQYYKRPATCTSESQQVNMVECGNHYIQERNKFEASWARRQGMD